MKRYVDGFVIPIPKKNLSAYKKMAKMGGEIWMKHGALEYFECVGEDLTSAKKYGCMPFPIMTKAKPGETVLFSFIVYKSKAHRNKVNAKVMKDSAMGQHKEMPFMMNRMAVGGFETIVWHKK